ncbi:MAG TPA: hydroxymethylglutaryl-CoA lyase [Bacteroidia bacterium]|nr:hydroxymethylglutaryl-CoA lyase [Bacteroidia bacterium]HQK97510.1 hydroxymethylglutaryl-CoA lyase [Bacteroidia bacterium]
MKIIECPRDAMQGIHDFIPTSVKANYINRLLKVGYDTIDFGSFVSPKAIPQLRDTADVLSSLDLSETSSKLLAIIANVRGGEDAVKFEEIKYLGFPFSISETFQQRNTNSSIDQSLKTVEQLQSICVNNSKELVVYISMAFGNPYGDLWNEEIAFKWVNTIQQLGVKIVAMSDTVGVASPEAIKTIFSHLIPALPNVEFGAHLHCTADNWKHKVNAAYQSGCRRFDAAIKGFGGCPMAEDELVGNLATENLISYLNENKVNTNLDMSAFSEAMLFSGTVFAS